MSLKLSDVQSAVAYHIVGGPVTFAYKIDANNAVSHFPAEWSHDPWSIEAEVKARAARGEPELVLTAEEQAAIAEHDKAVAEASERLKAFREKQASMKAEADQAVADEAIIKSAPPRPDPAVKRPFGRKGEPTKAEIKMMKAKDDEDKFAAASRSGAPITG